ncbi:MAG: fucose isomerase [Lachnospiraceae bacterium]|nr:fucose isomerase [Lachnospiraceae bacterium]
MLKNISKLLTGNMLKILCDMGHGDELVIADANFPAENMGQRVIHCPGMDGSQFLQALLPLFPLDSYTEKPVALMDLTDGDKAKGMPEPVIWAAYERLLIAAGENPDFDLMERYAFYERAKKAYVVVQTGEERQYGNLLLVKGVVK